MALIELRQIGKSYPDGASGRRTVLENLSLQVEKGAFVAVTGPSGCGKTTLLNILGTLLPPDTGSYRLDGTDITGEGVDLPAIRNRQIGFLFQDHRLIPQYTVLQNVLLPVLARENVPSEEVLAYARELLEKTGIAPLAQSLASTLSGGEASRAALCRALVMRPALLLADEPTGQLDQENGRKIVELLRQVKELGTTLVLVTHSAETAAAADRIYTLQDRRLIEV